MVTHQFAVLVLLIGRLIQSKERGQAWGIFIGVVSDTKLAARFNGSLDIVDPRGLGRK